MPKRKAEKGKSKETIRKPIAEKTIKGLTLTKEQFDSLEVDEIFENFPTSQWSDLNKLIEQSINLYTDTIDGQDAFNSIVKSLETIRRKKLINDILTEYCSKCISYLTQDHITKLFNKKFASAVQAYQIEELKKESRRKGYRNAVLITSQSGDDYYKELNTRGDDNSDDISGDAQVEGSNKRQRISNNEPVDDLNKVELEEGDSFHSDNYHPRRKQIYVCTNICTNFSADQGSRWIVNNVDVSQELCLFGICSLRLHEQMDSLSDLRLLALDHVFAFSTDIEDSVTKYIGQSMHNSIIEDLFPNNVQFFPQLLPAITQTCSNLSLLNNTTPWIKVMDIAADIVQNTRGKGVENVLYGSILYKTATTLCSIGASTVEDTFVHTCVHNLLSSTFGCDKYFIQEWANASLQSEKAYQPDWSASVKLWKKTYNIVAAEAKPVSKQNRGVISDYVKLGREMKMMVEELVMSGVEDPEAFGILIKGPVMELYVMDVVSDGIYRLVELDSLNLATSFPEIINLMRTMPILYQFKERCLSLVKRLEESELKKSKGVLTPPSLPVSWFRHSMDAKMKILK